jgi:hypothetical protein
VVVANRFVRALNTCFAAGIPRVSIRQVAADDPLVFPDAGHPELEPDDHDPSSKPRHAIRAGQRR